MTGTQTGVSGICLWRDSALKIGAEKKVQTSYRYKRKKFI